MTPWRRGRSSSLGARRDDVLPPTPPAHERARIRAMNERLARLPRPPEPDPIKGRIPLWLKVLCSLPWVGAALHLLSYLTP